MEATDYFLRNIQNFLEGFLKENLAQINFSYKTDHMLPLFLSHCLKEKNNSI